MRESSGNKTIKLRSLIFSTVFNNAFLSILSVLIFISLVLSFGINSIGKGIARIIAESLTMAIEEVMDHAVDDAEKDLDAVEKQMASLRIGQELLMGNLEAVPPPEPLPRFGYHENGAFYQLDDWGGSSLYYPAALAIDEEKLEKAAKTLHMDRLLRQVAEGSGLVVQAYFNAWDGMNRLYPFMADAPAQYGPAAFAPEYNFYWLADAAHNPGREPVWTEAYLDPAGRGWMVSCIVPVYSGSFLEGVSGADITLSALIGNLLGINLPVDSALFLAGSDGGIIAMDGSAEALFGMEELTGHIYSQAVGYTVYKPEQFNMQAQPENSAGRQLLQLLGADYRSAPLSADGGSYIVQTSPISSTGWQMFIVTDTRSLSEQVEAIEGQIGGIIRASLAAILLIIIIMLLVSLLLANRVAKTIAEPILHLQMATSSLGHEMKTIEYGKGMHIEEINDLFSQYNKMVEELDERTRMLIEKEAQRKMQQEIAEKYRTDSNRDSLTGIANRRRIDDALEEEMEKAVRDENPLSLILIDIDNFKEVNDTFGHLVGDEVLIQIAGLLVDNTQSTDIVGRWGGEEFMVICPYTDGAQAGMLAEKLRKLMADAVFATGSSQTASFGVAEYGGEDKKSFINRVDTAMYSAKKTSKNKVVLHEHEA